MSLVHLREIIASYLSLISAIIYRSQTIGYMMLQPVHIIARHHHSFQPLRQKMQRLLETLSNLKLLQRHRQIIQTLVEMVSQNQHLQPSRQIVHAPVKVKSDLQGIQPVRKRINVLVKV